MNQNSLAERNWKAGLRIKFLIRKPESWQVSVAKKVSDVHVCQAYLKQSLPTLSPLRKCTENSMENMQTAVRV